MKSRPRKKRNVGWDKTIALAILIFDEMCSENESSESMMIPRSFSSNMCSNSLLWAYGVVVNMFDFHRSDRGSNPGRGGKIS